ncbi:MAG: hypothetical protein JSR78_11680 [Proteobacteria bacterium]|nr:hypothetical protein [Pseudomonadota bacterium]
MLPDDVFRDRLEKTLVEIEAAVARMRDYAAVDVTATPAYWRVVVLPVLPEACLFELLITSKQTFSLKLAEETFENLPVEHFELFPHLVHAIEAGRVEKISKFDAMTDELVAIEMRVMLGPGWDWRGERRIAKAPPEEIWRTHGYLAYRR